MHPLGLRLEASPQRSAGAAEELLEGAEVAVPISPPLERAMPYARIIAIAADKEVQREPPIISSPPDFLLHVLGAPGTG